MFLSILLWVVRHPHWDQPEFCWHIVGWCVAVFDLYARLQVEVQEAW